MVDIALAVLLGVLTLVTAYLGVHVTLHPAESRSEKLAYKIGFSICGLAACILIGVQTYRNNTSQGQLRGEIARIERNTEQPPRVSVTNSIPPAQVILQGSSAPSGRASKNQGGIENLTDSQLRNKTLNLSTRMLDFDANMHLRLGSASAQIVFENGAPTPDSERERKVYADSMTVYNNTLLKEAVDVRAELWHRIGAVPPDTPMDAFSSQPTETDRISERRSVISDGAQYLVKLAGQLPK